MLGILKALRTTVSTMLRQPVTVQYPTQMRKLPARSRGLPLLVWDHEHDEPFCIGCRQCDDICPVQCISVAGPVENPCFRPRSHDEGACKAANNGACIHTSPRRTLPAAALDDALRFIIDEDRCMRCGLCEWVCPTDQERYGNQKAIVLGTGHLSIQSAVYDRNNNVLDLKALTHHSRVLRLELNAVMGAKAPKEGLVVYSSEAAGLRLNGEVVRVKRPGALAMQMKALFLRVYAPIWLRKKGLPLKPRDGRETGAADSWPSIGEALGGRKNRKSGD